MMQQHPSGVTMTEVDWPAATSPKAPPAPPRKIVRSTTVAAPHKLQRLSDAPSSAGATGYLQLLRGAASAESTESRVEVAAMKLAMAQLGHARLGATAHLQSLDVAGLVAERMPFHRSVVELDNGQSYSWEQTADGATLFFSPREGDDFSSKDVRTEGGFVLVSSAAWRSQGSAATTGPPSKKAKAAEIMWLQQEVDDSVTVKYSSVQRNYFPYDWDTKTASPELTITFAKVTPGIAVTQLLKGEMSEEDVLRMQQEDMKRARHPAVFHAFCETWGPELHLLVKKIQVSNKARYCDVEITTPGGTGFAVNWREGGAGVADDMFSEWYCQEHPGAEEIGDLWSNEDYQQAYHQACIGMVVDLASALSDDPVGVMLAQIGSSSKHMGSGEIKLLECGSDVELRSDGFSVAQPYEPLHGRATIEFGDIEGLESMELTGGWSSDNNDMDDSDEDEDEGDDQELDVIDAAEHESDGTDGDGNEDGDDDQSVAEVDADAEADADAHDDAEADEDAEAEADTEADDAEAVADADAAEAEEAPSCVVM
jgi:hypothetical protein